MKRRLEDILEYIEIHPGNTAYSLSKIGSLKLNKETARLSLIILEEKGNITLVKRKEKGRTRKEAYLQT